MLLSDLTGQTFGRLTVLGEGEAYRTPAGVRRRRWRCVCECGSETLLEGGKLTSGNTRSCGCGRQHRRTENPNYRGDEVTYAGMHKRLRGFRGRARDHRCVGCDSPASDWAYVGNCSDQRLGVNRDRLCLYCPHVEHYSPMCRSCHWRYDRPTERGS